MRVDGGPAGHPCTCGVIGRYAYGQQRTARCINPTCPVIVYHSRGAANIASAHASDCDCANGATVCPALSDRPESWDAELERSYQANRRRDLS